MPAKYKTAKKAVEGRNIPADVKNRDFAPVYLIYGEEAYLRENYKNALIRTLTTPGDNLNYTVFSGNNTDPSEVVSLAMTLPFMAERRVIYVKDSDFFKKASPEIADYIENPSPDTVLIFDESNIDRGTAAYKAASQGKYEVLADRYDEDKLPNWVGSDFSRFGKGVTRETVDLLIQRVGNDMTALDMEVKKLAAFAEGRDEVTSEDVLTLVHRSPAYSVYEMIEAIGNKDLSRAVGIYYDMMAEDQNPYGVFTLLARQFRIMLKVSDMYERKVSVDEMAKALKLPYGVVRKYIEQIKRFSRAGMQKALEECVRAPRDIARGKIDKEIAMELLIVGIASA